MPCKLLLLALVMAGILFTASGGLLAEKPAAAKPTAEEAPGRAALLHETVHAMLHVVHHQYYREDEALPIPAATFEKVFSEVARLQGVELRWIAVDAQAMNADNKPKTKFEKEAAAALASGKEVYEATEKDVYRHAGAITLTSDCLKCHVPNRTSNQDRTAALIISMPVRQP